MSRAGIRSPLILVGLLAILVLFAGIALPMFLGGSSSSMGADGRPKAVLSIEHDGFLYTYHVPTDTEGLFDLEGDPRRLKNLAPARRQETMLLRALLTEELGIADLSELRVHFDNSIRTLESLGYL